MRRQRHQRSPSQRRPGAARGFSMIELVAVIAIVGVLAVIAIPRFNTTGFDRYAFRHELLSALRHAQKTAMASGCAVAVVLDGGADRFSVMLQSGGSATDCGGGSFDTALRHPASGDDYVGTAAAGADLQIGGTQTLVFDGFGGYVSGPTTISLAGGAPIRIDNVTGYVRD